MMMKEAATPISLDPDTLRIAQQLLHFSRPSPTQKKARINHVGQALHTPPHKIITPTKFAQRLTMSPVPFPTSALAASSTSSTSSKTISINSCEDMTPEELLRQHRLRFKSIRQRWQKWHRERRKRLSRFEVKPHFARRIPQTPSPPLTTPTNDIARRSPTEDDR
ncbi:hypothetical protein AC1031_001432 [Aphanomyces cochlioides]|nr:hypothetical protein AC1031_001432 [Aphanomyces cochlioides]